jgi:hypothetical protein
MLKRQYFNWLCFLLLSIATTIPSMAQVSIVGGPTLECLEIAPPNGFIDEFEDSLRLSIVFQIPQAACDYVQVLVIPADSFTTLPLVWQALHCPTGNIEGYQFENVTIQPNVPRVHAALPPLP